MLFKKEVLVTPSMDHLSKALDLLSQHKINYATRTKDNFGGGMYSERRFTGDFGMDTSSRFIYHVYVSKKDYEHAVFILNS